MATQPGDQDSIAAGSTAPGQDSVKIPEGIMKPKDMTHDSKTDIDPTNVASGKPVNAKGLNVDESETKIPEGIMKPKETTASGDSANIAAGEIVDASGKKSADEHAKIPEGIMKPGSVS